MKSFLTITLLFFSTVTFFACSKPSKSPGSITAPVEEKVETKTETSPKEKEVVYTCTMHPEILSKIPGDCPICGMTLVPKE